MCSSCWELYWVQAPGAHGLNQGAGGNRRDEEEAPSRNYLQEEAGGCYEHGVSNTDVSLDVPGAVSVLAWLKAWPYGGPGLGLEAAGSQNCSLDLCSGRVRV